MWLFFIACVRLRMLQSWLDEWLWTFLLVLVVFSVASSKRDSNAFFGLAIGCVVLAGDSFFGPFSKGFFNPGVGTGVCVLSVFEKKAAHALWIYWVCRAGAPVVAWSRAVACCFRFSSCWRCCPFSCV